MRSTPASPGEGRQRASTSSSISRRRRHDARQWRRGRRQVWPPITRATGSGRAAPPRLRPRGAARLFPSRLSGFNSAHDAHYRRARARQDSELVWTRTPALARGRWIFPRGFAHGDTSARRDARSPRHDAVAHSPGGWPVARQQTLDLFLLLQVCRVRPLPEHCAQPRIRPGANTCSEGVNRRSRHAGIVPPVDPFQTPSRTRGSYYASLTSSRARQRTGEVCRYVTERRRHDAANPKRLVTTSPASQRGAQCGRVYAASERVGDWPRQRRGPEWCSFQGRGGRRIQ